MNTDSAALTADTAETIVLGMGVTGVACIRFLLQHGVRLHVMDSRPNPPNLSQLQQQFPELSYQVGGFDRARLCAAKEIVISPGLSLAQPDLAAAQALGMSIISEIELFARYVNAPVVAITGSNGKSTVTTLVGEMATQAGWQVRVGGNLGTAALDLLSTPAPDLYVLELSSFQLESTQSLRPAAAVVLNISEDHMDRYDSLADYAAVKAKIYQQATMSVINADDPMVLAMLSPTQARLSFSLQDQQANFCVGEQEQQPWLMYRQAHALQALLPVSELPMSGSIMQANALAALALGQAVGIPMSEMLTALRQFRGLPHRCALVKRAHGVDWYNDSKGTNVGATIAAIQTLSRPKQIVLIAGGDGKGADFSLLAELAKQHLRACVVLGKDGEQIGRLLRDAMPVQAVKDMHEAVTQAQQLAQAGDAVLLSPACSSLDMFRNYEHRGEVFSEAVLSLT